MIKTIKAGQYQFRIDTGGSIEVEYNDGKVIDLKHLNIINVGVMQQEDMYTVTLTTSESIQKIGAGITHDLELVGFHFKDLNEAIAIQNTIAIHLFNKEKLKEAND